MSDVPGVQLLQPLSTHRSPIEAQSGIALIVVMISIFVLAILAGGFAFSMKIETKLARNANNETELEWLGRSGVEYARYIIAEQAKLPASRTKLSIKSGRWTGRSRHTNSPWP